MMCLGICTGLATRVGYGYGYGSLLGYPSPMPNPPPMGGTGCSHSSVGAMYIFITQNNAKVNTDYGAECQVKGDVKTTLIYVHNVVTYLL